MIITCPKGWKKVYKLNKHTTLETGEVNICGDICDSPDLCKIEDCEYYDISREATRKFQKATLKERTLEGWIARNKSH